MDEEGDNMLKLIGYLKPYTVFILVAIALLFVQALTELALPDYMSKIVNVGIQQGGIEDAIPQAISQETFNDVALFMSRENKEAILGYYELITQDSSDYQEYLERYPALETEPVYVLVNDTIENNQELKLTFGKALMAYSGVKSGGAQGNENFSPPSGVTIPEGADPLKMMRLLPENIRLQMLSDMDKMVEVL